MADPVFGTGIRPLVVTLGRRRKAPDGPEHRFINIYAGERPEEGLRPLWPSRAAANESAADLAANHADMGLTADQVRRVLLVRLVMKGGAHA